MIIFWAVISQWFKLMMTKACVTIWLYTVRLMNYYSDWNSRDVNNNVLSKIKSSDFKQMNVVAEHLVLSMRNRWIWVEKMNRIWTNHSTIYSNSFISFVSMNYEWQMLVVHHFVIKWLATKWKCFVTFNWI